MGDVKVFVATHDASQVAAVGDPYQTLFVGAARFAGDIPADMARDDGKDSISWKNPYYCELTGLYWIWKHCDAAIKGIVHYRRYLATPETPAGELPAAPLTEQEIRNLLSGCDALVAKSEYYARQLFDHYYHCHLLIDLQILRAEIAKGDSVYLDAFDQVMQSNAFHPYNMWVASREIFDAYCAWVFPLLENCESRIDPFTGRTAYQARVFGFLAERLLNVFLVAKGLTLAECPVYSADEQVARAARDRYQPVEPFLSTLRQMVTAPGDASSFDIDYYIDYYEDLRVTFQGDYQPFEYHYYHWGLGEKRRGSPEFAITDYMNIRPDLRATLREDYPAYLREFDQQLQVDPCPLDLPLSANRVLGVTQLDEMDYAPVYDYAYYIDRYPDAPRDEFDSEVTLRHFLEVGMPEGRVGSARFDVRRYYAKRKGRAAPEGMDFSPWYQRYLRSCKHSGLWRILHGGASGTGGATNAAGGGQRSYLLNDSLCPRTRWWALFGRE